MKNFLVSVLIHLLILLALQVGKGHLFDLENSSPAVVVEIYIPPVKEGSFDVIEKARQTPQEKKRSVPTPVSDRLKTAQSGTAHAKMNISQTDSYSTASFLKSQEGRKMIASYAEQLKIYLEQNKKYPKSAIRLRHSGVVKVKLEIRTNGRFGSIQIISPSPFETLNQAAVALLESLGHFKPLPVNYEGSEEFIIPIAYQLGGNH